jgi:hypothetical protein
MSDLELEMTPFEELTELCARRRYSLRLGLVDATNRDAGPIPVHPDGAFRLRVFAGDDVLAGRLQSEPGRESLDQLAAGCLHTLRNQHIR